MLDLSIRNTWKREGTRYTGMGPYHIASIEVLLSSQKVLSRDGNGSNVRTARGFEQDCRLRKVASFGSALLVEILNIVSSGERKRKVITLAHHHLFFWIGSPFDGCAVDSVDGQRQKRDRE